MISKQDIYIIEKCKRNSLDNQVLCINEAERVVLFFLLLSYTHMTFSCSDNGLLGDKNNVMYWNIFLDNSFRKYSSLKVDSN